MFTVVAIVVLFVLGATLGELLRRSRARIARLERSQTIDPATALGTPFALERELANAVRIPWNLSITEIQIADVGKSRDAANALRAICAHGVDQIFCLDLARGSFLLMTYGKLDPDRVAAYFESELATYGFPAKIGWAYCRSADPAIRQGVRAAARAALLQIQGSSGVEVALVEAAKWPADDLSEIVVGLSLRTRREALCLTRREFAKIVNVSETALRDIEVGRARPAEQAKFILWVADVIEQSIARVQHVTSLVAASAARALKKPSADTDSAGQITGDDKASVAQQAMALQRSILAERSAGQEKVTVPPSPPAPDAADQASEAVTPGGEHSATGEAMAVGRGDADAAK